MFRKTDTAVILGGLRRQSGVQLPIVLSFGEIETANSDVDATHYPVRYQVENIRKSVKMNVGKIYPQLGFTEIAKWLELV